MLHALAEGMLYVSVPLMHLTSHENSPSEYFRRNGTTCRRNTVEDAGLTDAIAGVEKLEGIIESRNETNVNSVIPKVFPVLLCSAMKRDDTEI